MNALYLGYKCQVLTFKYNHEDIKRFNFSIHECVIS